MTPEATKFITPLTLSTLSKNKVYVQFVNEQTESWNNHVKLGLWADLMLIAPATLNTLSKMVSGQCDNLLLATYFSAKCPVYFAPAMDLDMYKHPATKKVFKKLASFGNTIIDAEVGELASGLSGQGRMASPEHIISFLEQDNIKPCPFWKGKHILITAGPTYEMIDPVRFIGNPSTGRMGVEIAKSAAEKGAHVTLILGPTTLKEPVHKAIKVVNVVNAYQMFEAVKQHFDLCDYAIAAAAVADYTPLNFSMHKIKKTDENLFLQLGRTTDILGWMGNRKNGRKLIGFALETENEIENAKSKLSRKNLDLIVLNSLNDKESGFKYPTNKVTFINHRMELKFHALKSKTIVAHDILNEIEVL